MHIYTSAAAIKCTICINVCRIPNLHPGIKMRLRLGGMSTRGGDREAGYTTMALGTGSSPPSAAWDGLRGAFSPLA